MSLYSLFISFSLTYFIDWKLILFYRNAVNAKVAII